MLKGNTIASRSLIFQHYLRACCRIPRSSHLFHPLILTACLEKEFSLPCRQSPNQSPFLDFGPGKLDSLHFCEELGLESPDPTSQSEIAELIGDDDVDYQGKRVCPAGWKLFNWGDTFQCVIKRAITVDISTALTHCNGLQAQTPRPATAEYEAALSRILHQMDLDETAIEVWSSNDDGVYKDGAGKDHSSKIKTGSGPYVSFTKMGTWKKQPDKYETRFLCMKESAEVDIGESESFCDILKALI